jgi:hypothetical protein
MKKIFTYFIIGIIMVGGLNAQNMKNERYDDPDKKEHCINDQPYYQYMVFRMTEVLELTPEQAEKLFPLNRLYRDEKHSLHMQKGKLSEEVFQKDEITKSDLDKYKKEINRLHEVEMKLDDEFIEDVEKFLEPAQVAKLMFFEPRFRKELSHELKQRYMPKPEEKKGKKFWNKRK